MMDDGLTSDVYVARLAHDAQLSHDGSNETADGNVRRATCDGWWCVELVVMVDGCDEWLR